MIHNTILCIVGYWNGCKKRLMFNKMTVTKCNNVTTSLFSFLEDNQSQVKMLSLLFNHSLLCKVEQYNAVPLGSSSASPLFFSALLFRGHLECTGPQYGVHRIEVSSIWVHVGHLQYCGNFASVVTSQTPGKMKFSVLTSTELQGHGVEC